jgi:hypothetical protein
MATKKRPKRQSWEVTMTVVNDIRGINGTLTRLVPKKRIKDIIRDEINNWRDLEARHIKLKKVR